LNSTRFLWPKQSQQRYEILLSVGPRKQLCGGFVVAGLWNDEGSKFQLTSPDVGSSTVHRLVCGLQNQVYGHEQPICAISHVQIVPVCTVMSQPMLYSFLALACMMFTCKCPWHQPVLFWHLLKSNKPYYIISSPIVFTENSVRTY